jgi:hypothetical protein
MSKVVYFFVPPNTSAFFLVVEVDMFEILETIQSADLIRVSGERGGAWKDSVVAAVVHAGSSKVFQIDDIFWLPTPEGVVPDQDSLLEIFVFINIMKGYKERCLGR